MADNQLQLFSEEETRPERPRSRKAGASTNIVFHDYESFLAKFTDRPKTTDDCFTPRDVYEAVVEYVGTVVDLSDKVILRPFFPGGDYENSDYPENGIVIDNPPFSLFIKIVAFYVMHRIPFFLFAPGMTVLNACRYCTAVLVDNQITWDNGAVVRVNFVSNLFGDTVAMTAPLLNRLLGACPSQNKPRLPSFSYPPNVMRVSDFNIICGGGYDYKLERSECRLCKRLDNRDMFGDFFIVSTERATAKETALQRAKETALQRAKETALQRAIPIQLSPREQAIVEELNNKQENESCQDTKI